MGATNTSFADATVISAFPYTFTQSDINDGGVNATVYYKFTAPVGARVFGAWGFSPIAETYRATLKVYTGALPTPTQVLAISSLNKPIQFPVTPGEDYYLEFTKNGDTSPASLAVSVLQAPAGAIAAGNILISDDKDADYEAGFPLAALSHLVDHTIVNFVNGVKSGESADSLANGNMLFEDRENYDLVLYDSSFSVLATIDFALLSGYCFIRANRATNLFWVGKNTNPVTIYKVTDAGVLSSVIATLTGHSTLRGLCTSPDDSILYFTNLNSSAIKRWNLTTNTAMTDLCAAIANTTITDMLGLPDGNIVVAYSNVYVAPHAFCRLISPTGTTVREYEVGTTYGMFQRLAYANDHPLSFWTWYHSSNGDIPTPNKFINFQISDGVKLTERDHTAYVLGKYLATETATPTGRFGCALSCPLLIMPGAPVTSGGIYYIHHDKATRHDSYYRDVEKKIPNPTFKTAYIGE